MAGRKNRGSSLSKKDLKSIGWKVNEKPIVNLNTEKMTKDYQKFTKTRVKDDTEVQENNESLYRQMLDKFTRWRRIANDTEDKENKERATSYGDVLKKSIQGAIGGFSVGKAFDLLAPREVLDNWSELREEYTKMFGESAYKDMKAGAYKSVKELNKEMGVAVFGAQDMQDALDVALKAKVDPKDMVEFTKNYMLTSKTVGGTLGASFANDMVEGFTKGSSQAMGQISNVLSNTTLSSNIRGEIADAVASNGAYISELHKDAASQANAATNLAATLSTVSEKQLMSVEQSQTVIDTVQKASRGDLDSIELLQKMGLSPSMMTKALKEGNYDKIMQNFLSQTANLGGRSSEFLKMLGLNINEDQIQAIRNRGDEIKSISTEVDTSLTKSAQVIDGHSQAELEAMEVGKQSIATRFANASSLSKVGELTSSILEKLNMDASTATAIAGGALGALGGLKDILITGKLLGGLSGLSGIVGSVGTGLATMGAALAPVLGVVAAVAALAGAAYLLYKNWDKVKKTASKVANWFKGKKPGEDTVTVGENGKGKIDVSVDGDATARVIPQVQKPVVKKATNTTLKDNQNQLATILNSASTDSKKQVQLLNMIASILDEQLRQVKMQNSPTMVL